MNTTTLDDRYVSADHIGAARDRGRIITLCAAMGMGKSTAIREYLRRMGDPPVMFVACRVLQRSCLSFFVASRLPRQSCRVVCGCRNRCSRGRSSTDSFRLGRKNSCRIL